jgi:tetratricopeptide (TPR) repeat protein
MKAGITGIFALLLFFPLLAVSAQTKPDALTAYRNGSYEQAVDICQNELKNNSDNLDSHVVICWSLIALGRYDDARKYALEGLSLSRYDNRLIEIMGEVNYYQGSNNDALRYFQQYINLAPDGSRIDRVYYFIGEIYIRLGEYRHADIALTTAVHHIPGNAAWWTRLAYARENAGDLSQAATAYQRALSLNAQDIDASRGLARVRSSLARQ